MKIFRKVRTQEGHREIYFCGRKVFSYRRLKPIKKNTRADYVEFVHFLEKNEHNFPPARKELSQETPSVADTRLIAFYLPQFHTIPLNDHFHGNGFTEWINVTKIKPQYTGHYQPHLPIDVGFYDLSHTGVMKRQIELARQYGIHGFCSYYYWFSGEKLLEKPFENYLADKSLDFPFCFCWVLENWTRRWDGGNREMMKEMNFSVEDATPFFNDILPFLKDSRWIKVGEKNLLLFYKLHIFPQQDVLAFTRRLREQAQEAGLPDFYLIACRTDDMFTNGLHNSNPQDWGFDAWADFPPHNLRSDSCPRPPAKMLTGYVNPELRAQVHDMAAYITQEQYRNNTCPYPLYQTVFPSWDNSSRCAKIGCNIFDGVTPDLYKKWLSYCIDWTREHHARDEQIVFINAWNEWAEGAHLEPDRKHGYRYLEATLDALEETAGKQEQ